MFIRLALLLGFIAFSLLIIATLLRWLALSALANLLMTLGIMALFTAFSLLVLMSFLSLTKLILNSISYYFSAPQCAQRKLYWTQTRHLQIKQLFSEKIRYIHYFNNLQRTRLLNRDNQKQIQALAKAIAQQIQTQKAQLNKTQLRQLQQELKRCQKQQNSTGLLQLQHYLMALKSND